MGTKFSFEIVSRTLVAILASIFLSSMPLTAAAQTESLRIAATPGVDVAPVFVGISKGIFLKYQLDAKIDLFPTGVEAINSQIGGNDDIGDIGIYPFLSAVSKGIPLIMISHANGDALASSLSDVLSLVATKSSGIRADDLASLKGKKIGVPFGSGAHSYIIFLLKQAGLGETDAKLINIQAANQVLALANGDVDALAIWEPHASNAIAKVPGAVRVMHGGAEGFYDPGIMAVTAKVRDSKPEILARFLVAYAEAQQRVRQNPEEAAQISMQWLPGIDLNVMTESIRSVGQDLRLSKNTIESSRNMAIPLMISDGRIKEAFDPSKYIDASIYLAAEKQASQFFGDLKPIPQDRLIAR